jgi:hypothetical protein
MPTVPSNIEEFNKIAGLIFAQLYRAFPVAEDIDRNAIANAFEVAEGNWATHKLPSGRNFSELLAHTIGWLRVEEYTKAFGSHPAERVILTTKGLMAMSAVPTGLKETVGSELRKVAEKSSGPDLGRVGDLVGGVIGGVWKSVMS